MYTVDEKKMERLLLEADNISRHLVFSRTAPIIDINKFGQALLEMQTTIRQQQFDKGKQLDEILKKGIQAGA